MRLFFEKFGSYIFLVLVFFTFLAVSILPERVDEGQIKTAQYLVIYSPWNTENQNIEKLVKSSGNPVDQGAFPFIYITASRNTDFVHDAYQNGALLVLNPVIKGGCFRISTNKFTEV